jgi:deazaflavin-dependent oxidoreductase (nitroreductase family)
MTRKKYSPFHSIIQRLAASPPGAWLLARSMHHLDRICLKLSGGRVSMTSLFTGLPVVILTTTGAKSGLPRTLPLLGIRDERDPTAFALIASNWGQRHYPAWYFNLRANPRAHCSIAGRVGHYVAHEATEEEYERFWRYAADTYLGYPLYKQRVAGRRIPILIMTPTSSQGA